MRGTPKTDRLKSFLGAACVGLLANLALPSPTIAASLRVTWASGTEADLAGYRLSYGTSPGQYDATIELGPVNSHQIDGLMVDERYYIVVTALDAAGNPSAPSAEVSARIPASLAPMPSVDATMEISTRSIYALAGRSTVFVVYGRNLTVGAGVDLGPGISVSSPVLNAQGDLQFVANVAPDAAPGPRTVTVTNQDGGIGSRSDTVTVVRSPDINRDCHVDVLDLNAFARAWNETTGESRYTDAADFDGDGYVGPEDLAIFVQYYLRVFPGCP